jgi:hypothetical protein
LESTLLYFFCSCFRCLSHACYTWILSVFHVS